ncbi:MAG: metal-binding protein [Eubacteriaceae bacterium]|nr:metal-binding protein [Eubacteriaceae bacterium]
MPGYSFFQNKDCEYFPCHKNIAPEDFNCLFCYCPLYFTKCGKDYKIIGGNIKDCSDCIFPHDKKITKK